MLMAVKTETGHDIFSARSGKQAEIDEAIAPYFTK
jgi:hypothetical protein